MTDAAVNNLKALKKAREDIAAKCRPAFDELLLYSLERRHLDVPQYSDMLVSDPEREGAPARRDHLQQNVRLFKLDEIAFDSDEKLHLPGVESALASLQNQGHSLLFIVQGDATQTCVYMGICKFAHDAPETSSILDGYEAVWKANFPGSRMENLSTAEAEVIAYEITKYKNIGVLTGIPSLKRKEEQQLFVQGLERLIRAMRGKTYSWVSIADPIPQEAVRDAISACQQLESDIHHLVKTDLSKATSNGKTVMFGLFGLAGEGKTEGSSKAEAETNTTGTTDTTGSSLTDTTGDTHSTSRTNTTGDTHSTSNTVGGSAWASGGASIGFLGTGGHAEAGASVNYNRTWGDAHSVSEANGTGDAHSISKSVGTSLAHSAMASLAKGWVNTVTQSVATQLAGGGFSSFGLTWTKTTTVGQELLNRKAQYAEEVLQAYEKRLQEGTALGMWNLGHYFCAADSNTYSQGIGVVNSLFAGMDSTYEPPRAIKVPTAFRDTLCRFQNVYLRFSDRPVSREDVRAGRAVFKDHPLGFLFNGPATPVNTRELAIATPVATQDVEGVSVSRRPAFGINLGADFGPGTKTLTLGTILDKGNDTNQSYRLSQANLTKHLAVFGLTGSGKTNTVHHLLKQLWKNERIPFLVIEPAKAEYRALATMDEFRDDLLVISAGIDRTAACPLRLNPFDFDPGSDTDANRVHVLTHIDRLKATFNASFPMYASMPYILEEAILEVYRERGWNLGHSENRFVDVYREDFRDYLPTLRDLYWKVTETVRRKGYFQEQQMNIEAALKARLSSLLVGAKGTMLDTPHSLPAKDLFERPVVVELENLGDDDEKSFLMGLLISRLYEYRKATFENDVTRPLKHVLVVEEAHRLLANIPDTSANQELGNPRGKAVSAFVDMLSEVRSYGEGVVVVDQLPSRVSPNIVKGTGAKIVHRLLAKDDRENVGGTMGLSDEQVADLSLLRTGQCVVSQDGDLKAFQVRIPKCEEHESRSGGEISEATRQYRSDHADFFASPSGGIDLEDGVFKDSLLKTMLAIGLGQDAAILSGIRPLRPVGEWPDRAEWFATYWKQSCAELWNLHGGDWRALLAFRTTGSDLLAGKDGSEESYRAAFADYFAGSRLAAESPTGKLAGIAFAGFLVNERKNVLEIVNRNFDLVKDATDRFAKLADAIRRALPMLEPRGIRFSTAIRGALVAEIVNRINPALVPETVEAFKRGEA